MTHPHSIILILRFSLESVPSPSISHIVNLPIMKTKSPLRNMQIKNSTTFRNKEDPKHQVLIGVSLHRSRVKKGNLMPLCSLMSTGAPHLCELSLTSQRKVK